MPFLFSAKFVGRSLPDGRTARARFVFSAAGFTLLELLTAVALIGILSGLVVGVGRRAGDAGRTARARVELEVLSVALDDYCRVYGDFPQTNDAAQLLQSLIGRRGPRNELIAHRALIETSRFTTDAALDPAANASAVLIDPWGHPYRYAYKSQVPWNNFRCVLYSAGADGRDSPTLLAGGLIDPGPLENADNLSATHN